MTARLVVRTPGGQRHEFPLQKAATTIGRGRQCDLVLENSYVSRLHAKIEQTDGGFILVDQDSTNGTFVNGQRVRGAHPLSPGDEIAIADISISVLEEAGEETTKTPLLSTARGSPIRCDSATWEVWAGDRKLEVRLSLQEFELLSFLAARHGRVCTREELGTAIWGRDNYDYNMLHRLMHRLKRKIETEGRRFIRNVPGVGYRIEAML